MKTVEIRVEGGVIQDVVVPEGVEVVVYDYDVDSTEEDLDQDEDGSECTRTVYQHNWQEPFADR